MLTLKRWLQRVEGQLRTRAPDYLAATDNYVAHIGATVAQAQITNGGPVILLQPENEYTGGYGNVTGGFPDPVYFAYVKKQYRDAGIVVPFINNDACKVALRSCISVLTAISRTRTLRPRRRSKWNDHWRRRHIWTRFLSIGI